MTADRPDALRTFVAAHKFRGPLPGARLIVLGAVHGNEPCGSIAIERILQELACGELEIIAGQLTLVPVANRLAYERGTRNGDRDLNRNFAPTSNPSDNEDFIANELCVLLAEHTILIDIHSFGWQSSPMVLLGQDSSARDPQPFAFACHEEALAAHLGVSRALYGWLATNMQRAHRRGSSIQYCKGTTDYMRSVGGYAVTLECGQHADPLAPELAYNAVRNALAYLRLIASKTPQPKQEIELLRVYEVIDKNSRKDRFVREWNSFDRLYLGDAVAYRSDGTPVLSPADGFILFPNTNAEPGTEWFYLAEPDPRALRKRGVCSKGK
ncbi:succinylglutamate desuccinylase/aspartoacylase family protein [Bradyrhizobium sp. CIR3A]|uniref:succinylglutamate desuccinylase/aspartoacylase domain-containing protein n=1 Tax=Bradyrhizobium sp. CIR3A TaxID=2663838 RepID=UPI001606A2C4|nr:succinylglutamate desuccinylase/aspartoacylase family protein [Bradyrhizobium sp. CIR3A]MBB4264309.1 putative deacylase [Bradyrhizobium sp. CIR3A]